MVVELFDDFFVGVLEICICFDGLLLVIELVVARTRVFFVV